MMFSKIKKKNNYRDPLIISLRISHLLISFLLLLFFMVLFLLPERALDLTPVCEWQVRYGVNCFFCGMTRAFFSISKLDFSRAFELNALSIPLFSALMINEIVTFITIRQNITSIRINYRNYNANC